MYHTFVIQGAAVVGGAHYSRRMLISDARIEGGKIQGNVRVTSGGELTLSGMITGTLTIESGGYASVGGMVGQLVVEPGGKAELGGMCTGDATNHGGELTVTGTVCGSLIGRASTYVAPSARIGQ